MAGSYNHCVDMEGRLLEPEGLNELLENGGDVFEAIEEMYGMIWFLAVELAVEFHTSSKPQDFIEQARRNYTTGLRFSQQHIPATERGNT